MPLSYDFNNFANLDHLGNVDWANIDWTTVDLSDPNWYDNYQVPPPGGIEPEVAEAPPAPTAPMVDPIPEFQQVSQGFRLKEGTPQVPQDPASPPQAPVVTPTPEVPPVAPPPPTPEGPIRGPGGGGRGGPTNSDGTPYTPQEVPPGYPSGPQRGPGGSSYITRAAGGFIDPIPQYKAAGGYTIQSGDTLGAIAQQHGTTVDALAQANQITDVNKIYAGQQLNLGQGAPQVPEVPAQAMPDPMAAPAEVPQAPVAEAIPPEVPQAQVPEAPVPQATEVPPVETLPEAPVEEAEVEITTPAEAKAAVKADPELAPNEVLTNPKKKKGSKVAPLSTEGSYAAKNLVMDAGLAGDVKLGTGIIDSISSWWNDEEAKAPSAEDYRWNAKEGKDKDVIMSFLDPLLKDIGWQPGKGLDIQNNPWCAAFVGSVLQNGGAKAGLSNPYAAKEYLKVGEEVGGIDNVQPGDVVVMQSSWRFKGDGGKTQWYGSQDYTKDTGDREPTMEKVKAYLTGERGLKNLAPQYHVGFYDSPGADGSFQMLGGNQTDGINVSSFPNSTVIGVRRVKLDDMRAGDEQLKGGS